MSDLKNIIEKGITYNTELYFELLDRVEELDSNSKGEKAIQFLMENAARQLVNEIKVMVNIHKSVFNEEPKVNPVILDEVPNSQHPFELTDDGLFFVQVDSSLDDVIQMIRDAVKTDEDTNERES